jgi:MFS family permease
VLAVLLAGMFMAMLDMNIVNVALPTLHADLRTSGSGLQLVVAGYTLAYAVLLIAGARLGGMLGHRRLFLTGLAVFTIASAACGLAPSTGALIAARFVQGAGAALMTPQVMSLIQKSFTGAARARALGLYTAVLAGGIVVGQVAGGLLVSADLFGSSWRPVFLVNVPIGAVVLAVGPRLLPADRGDPAVGFDVAGLAVVSPAVFLVVLPLILGHDQGWPAWCVASLAVGVALFGVFALVERRVAAGGGRPLVPGRVLRAPGLLLAALALVLAPGSWGAFLFTTTLHLQGDLGFDALRSGLAFVPAVAAFALVSLGWQRLPGRVHHPLVPAGFLIAAAGYLFIGPLAGGGVRYEALTAVIGLGLGVTPIMLSAALAHVPLADAADASGFLLTLMQLGQVGGIATIGTLFLTEAAARHSTRHAEYATGWTLAGTVLVAAVVAALLARATRSPRLAAAR